MAGSGVPGGLFASGHPLGKEAPAKAVSLPKLVLSKYDYNPHDSITTYNRHRVTCGHTAKCTFLKGLFVYLRE